MQRGELKMAIKAIFVEGNTSIDNLCHFMREKDVICDVKYVKVVSLMRFLF